MNRIDRLTAILIQLQSKRLITAQEVAERFDISIRTVYRDIRALEEAGVPIGAEAGKGYFIMEGYHLPPVMFTREEASAMLLGSKILEKQSDQTIKENFDNALLKIKAVLKFQEKDHLENLEDHIAVLSIPKMGNTDFSNNFLSEIQNAIVNRETLKFDYFSNYSGQLTPREAEPSGLCHYGDHWHLIAYCRMRNDFRDFRIDRISKLQRKNEHFTKDRKADFQNFVKKMILGSPLEEAKLLFDKAVVRYIGQQKYYHGFVEEREQEDGVEMTFMTPDLKYFARWVLMFGSAVSVVSPEALNERIVSFVEELQQHYLKFSQKKF